MEAQQQRARAEAHETQMVTQRGALAQEDRLLTAAAAAEQQQRAQIAELIEHLKQQLTTQAELGTAMQNILTKGAGSPGRSGDTQLIDTRLLGKPSHFSGDTDSDGRSTDGIVWQTWSFTTKAYAAAMAPRMSQLMKDAAGMSEAVENVSNGDLGEDDVKHSITLYFVLALLLKGKALGILQSCEENEGLDAWKRLTHEFEPKVAGRFQGMLTNLLNPEKFKGSDPSATIRSGVKAIEDNEKQSRDKVADTIRISILSQHLVDDDVARHSKLNSSRLNTFEKVLAEVTNYLLSNKTWTNDDGAMVIDALGKGGKKGKDGKGKDTGEQVGAIVERDPE